MTPDALQRITYDATVDDAVDVSFRLANRSQAFRKQIRTNVTIAGIAAGLGFVGVWFYIGGGRTIWEFVVSVAGGIVFGFLFAVMFRRFVEREIRKQHRKIIGEQFGGKPTIPSELELRPDAVWVRQAGMEMIFPWTLCTSIQDNPEDIEMNFSPGICVVRNRNFSTPAERQTFLETARQLSGRARSG